MIQAIFSIIQITFIWWVPESPRWLISKDRNDEALQMLTKYHANGDASHPTVQFEYAEIKETLRLEFLHKKSSSYLDFIKTAGNRHRLLLLFCVGKCCHPYSVHAAANTQQLFSLNGLGML